ncbi:MAG: HAD-IB family hydrolase [Cellulomonadaceae bacterium]|jgi:HAD superfamily hydrolase (TIGR01490 family)|nr:HAD-IB family hydrolase [Cellulomonadaceae bacterium]
MAESTNAQPTGAAAFFDVDNTVIRGAAAYHLARELYRRHFFSTMDIARFGVLQARYLLFGESKKDIENVKDRALGLIAGRTVAEVTAVGEDVYDQVIQLRIYPGSKKLIETHLAHGDQVWFVTAAPVEIGGLIAKRLGATGCLGTEAEHIKGVYTGKMKSGMMHGTAKAEAISELAEREGIDLAESSAYGDSVNDLPMMQAVGNPCPINPDRKLRIFARDAGWPIREFRGRGYRMRNRSLQTASAAGAAWGIGVAYRAIKRFVEGRSH